MREENTESKGRLAELASKLFGKKEAQEEKATATDETPAPDRVTVGISNYSNIKAPMSQDELVVCMMPRNSAQTEPRKYRKLLELFGLLDHFLYETRQVSKINPENYSRASPGKTLQETGEVERQSRIRGIQQQMSAVRYRLNNHDYENSIEAAILKNRMFELYHQAKLIDPEGTGRYERMLDKQMRRAR